MSSPPRPPSADNEEDGAKNPTAAKTSGFVAFSEFAMSIFKALTFKPPQLKSPPPPTPPPIQEVSHEATPPEPVVVEEEWRPDITIEIVKGDTLWGLSRKYGVSIEAIKEANGINGDTIYAGRKLIIP